MDDLTAVLVKTRIMLQHELTLQEKLEFRLTDLEINSKAKRQITIEDFLNNN
jgi:hypothetical protein